MTVSPAEYRQWLDRLEAAGPDVHLQTGPPGAVAIYTQCLSIVRRAHAGEVVYADEVASLLHIGKQVAEWHVTTNGTDPWADMRQPVLDLIGRIPTETGGTMAERIRHMRERAGLTQEQLAEALGVTPATLSRWERGARLPSRHHWRCLVDAVSRYEEES